jgi:hypothetical protein
MLTAEALTVSAIVLLKQTDTLLHLMIAQNETF